MKKLEQDLRSILLTMKRFLYKIRTKLQAEMNEETRTRLTKYSFNNETIPL